MSSLPVKLDKGEFEGGRGGGNLTHIGCTRQEVRIPMRSREAGGGAHGDKFTSTLADFGEDGLPHSELRRKDLFRGPGE